MSTLKLEDLEHEKKNLITVQNMYAQRIKSLRDEANVLEIELIKHQGAIKTLENIIKRYSAESSKEQKEKEADGKPKQSRRKSGASKPAR